MVKLIQTPWRGELQMEENTHPKGGPPCPTKALCVANDPM